MNTQNKLKVFDMLVDIHFLSLGCAIDISWKSWNGGKFIFGSLRQDTTKYFVSCTRKSLEIQKFSGSGWKTLIDPSMTLDPQNISESEKLLVNILPGLTSFERELYEVAGNVAKMWSDEHTQETDAREYVRKFLHNHLDWDTPEE